MKRPARETRGQASHGRTTPLRVTNKKREERRRRREKNERIIKIIIIRKGERERRGEKREGEYINKVRRNMINSSDDKVRLVI